MKFSFCKLVFRIFLFLHIFIFAGLFSIVDFHDCTSFTIAANAGNLNCVMSLIDKYKNKDDKNFLINCQDDNGGTALSRSSFHGHISIIKFLLQNGAEVDKTNNYGTTPLCWAKNVEVAKVLVDYGADVNKADVDGFNPLIRAIQKNNLDLVVFLVSQGAQIDVKKQNTHLLFFTSYLNSLEIFEFLIQQPGIIEIENEFRARPLSWFSKVGDLDIVKLLVRKYVDDIDHKDKNGYTALHMAIREEREDIVSFLLGCGANPNLCDNNGVYPIHSSSLNGSFYVTKKLLKYGSIFCEEDCEGMTPLMNAIISGSYKLINTYIKKIILCNKTDEFKKISRYKRRSILHWLLRKHPNSVVKKHESPYNLYSFYRIFNLIIKKCGKYLDFSHIDYYGCTIVHWLAKVGDYKSLHALCKFLYNENHKNIKYIKDLLTDVSCGGDEMTPLEFIEQVESEKYFKIDREFYEDLELTKNVIKNWLNFYYGCKELNKIKKRPTPDNSDFHCHCEKKRKLD